MYQFFFVALLMVTGRVLSAQNNRGFALEYCPGSRRCGGRLWLERSSRSHGQDGYNAAMVTRTGDFVKSTCCPKRVLPKQVCGPLHFLSVIAMGSCNSEGGTEPTPSMVWCTSQPHAGFDGETEADDWKALTQVILSTSGAIKKTHDVCLHLP